MWRLYFRQHWLYIVIRYINKFSLLNNSIDIGWYLELMVICPLGVLIAGEAFVWVQVLHLDGPHGNVPRSLTEAVVLCSCGWSREISGTAPGKYMKQPIPASSDPNWSMQVPHGTHTTKKIFQSWREFKEKMLVFAFITSIKQQVWQTYYLSIA